MPNAVAFQDPTYVLKLTHHKKTGQAVVCHSGKDHYCGRFGTDDARVKYDRLVGEWLARGRQQAPTTVAGKQVVGPTVNEVILAYMNGRVLTYYTKHGKPTSEQHCIRAALRPLKRLYGGEPADKFTPLNLEAVQAAYVQADLCRKTCNKHLHRVRRLFRWAEKQGLVPKGSYHNLLCVEPLQKGRTRARETPKVKPVPDACVDAVRPLVSRQVRAMIDLQLLTGMRPGEVCAMRPMDLDRSAPVWAYRPGSHKTEHHESERVIFLGPQAQAVLLPFLGGDPTAPCFRPDEAEEERNANKRASRQSPMTPSQATRRRKKGRRPWGEQYKTPAYCRAIARACAKAFPPPDEVRRGAQEFAKLASAKKRSGLKGRAPKAAAAAEGPDLFATHNDARQWARRHTRHPHQLRHNAATQLERAFGREVSRTVLGHSDSFTTEIFVEQDRAKAADAMLRAG